MGIIGCGEKCKSQQCGRSLTFLSSASSPSDDVAKIDGHKNSCSIKLVVEPLISGTDKYFYGGCRRDNELQSDPRLNIGQINILSVCLCVVQIYNNCNATTALG